MDESQAVASFAALSQETRLRVLRRLVQAGPDGLAAGVIADAVAVSPSNLSFHLKELERAGLIAQRRAARSIIYAANYEALGELIRFLMEDCCSGRIEICGPAIASVTCCDDAATTTNTSEEADA
ncbi:metalloregulator ArsR/SmtB family transcription factor [Bradyrhizobium sp. LHD-71]|uniref:ArsR/SmtB family transcription factor n=1 Tax=Bradyrhizobium sp. LHD-71 TaxID=3072141 RepID=UPI00280E9F8B|nr:metalloregulator ArsR/SmtB family transcription factor [Bradyrhizobium sp. LHD-71]MDQ8730782.1 metalloregulator ArsR/SmtB family transcription factor [Bradyrhizobium sp. LHD-71]